MCLSIPLTSMEYHDVLPNISLSRMSAQNLAWTKSALGENVIFMVCHLLPFANVGQSGVARIFQEVCVGGGGGKRGR